MLAHTNLNLKHALLLGTSIAAFAWSAAPAMAQNNNGGGNETVIVTGTRVQGMTAADSAAPVTVLGADILQHTGTADLRQALGQTVPSFTAQQFGSDTANLTLSAALRGLSPNDTLVLVNGKRRHYTGNLQVDGGSFTSGSSAADISLIPSAAIDHVEVLLDGAAAQYGTDAIAGVVNIILKKKSSGGQFSATGGDFFNRGGQTTTNGVKAGGTSYDLAFNMGMPLFDKGFVNLTIEKQYGNFTQNGGVDTKVAGQGPDGTGLQTSNVNGSVPLATAQLIPGYPRSNPIVGNPEFQLTQAAVNSAYDFSDNVQLYAFGTVSHRYARSYENNRSPNKVIAAPGSNQPCSATNPSGYATAFNAAGDPTCAIGVAGNWTDGGVSAGPGTQQIPTAIGLSGSAGQGLNSKGQVIFTTAGNGANGSYTSPGELIFSTTGFRPLEVLREEDYQYNMGMKFNVLGWDVDVGGSYGKDIDRISTENSSNVNLFADTHTAPSNYYDGAFTSSQLTGTIDATHQFNVGMASPLTVALGVEAREDLYGISAGDAPSQYGAGAASYPGNVSTTAGSHSRKNYAVYADLALAPIESLQLDVAGRAEHYTDFGDTQIGKVTARYDFNPMFAIRGTISTGFRAPTIAEEFYTAVNVSPTSATAQLPADSAAAKVLGLQNLKPETSTSYSAGIVAHPFEDLSATVDVYSTAIGNRIVPSSTVYLKGGTPLNPAVGPAIAAAGVTIDPTVTQVGASAFVNGVSTLTQGVDLTINYPTDFGDMGLVDWTLAGNYNNTAVSRVAPTPPALGGGALFQPFTLYNYAHSAPGEKVGLTANWSMDQFGATFRETYYGAQHSQQQSSGGNVTPFNQAGVGLTDLELRYNVTEQLGLALGANNIFNIRPDRSPWILNEFDPGAGPGDGGQVVGIPFAGSAFSPNGGYYYGRITYNF
jgi:iron complex outermembrane recepter protein